MDILRENILKTQKLLLNVILNYDHQYESIMLINALKLINPLKSILGHINKELTNIK